MSRPTDNTSPERSPSGSVALALIAVCVAVFLLVNVMGSDGLARFTYRHLFLWPLGTGLTEPWQVLSYGFLHGSFEHLLFNMFAVWMFGRSIEQALGSQRFLVYYFACLLSAALTQLLVQALTGDSNPTIGASGAVFGLLMAYGAFYPNAKIMFLLLPVPIKAKWFVLLYAAAELLFGLTGMQPTVAHFAHLGGLIGGALLLTRWGWRPARH